MGVRKRSVKESAVIALVGGAVVLTGGVAAAATGVLPGAADDAATHQVTGRGADAPPTNAHPTGHARHAVGHTTGGHPTHPVHPVHPGHPTHPVKQASTGSDELGDSADPAPARHGAEVSTLARTTPATGAAKGAAISMLASGGKSRAGQHGHNGPSTKHAPDPHSDGPATTGSTPAGPPSRAPGKSHGKRLGLVPNHAAVGSGHGH